MTDTSGARNLFTIQRCLLFRGKNVQIYRFCGPIKCSLNRYVCYGVFTVIYFLWELILYITVFLWVCRYCARYIRNLLVMIMSLVIYLYGSTFCSLICHLKQSSRYIRASYNQVRNVQDFIKIRYWEMKKIAYWIIMI